jgi:hypothetical protein
MVCLSALWLWWGRRFAGSGPDHHFDRLSLGRITVVTVKFKNSPLGITANKLNKAFLASGGGTGSGDMTKAVYDADNNGIVDTADSIPWTRVTGKPTALGDMTKAVYDTNNDGISDHAALADAAPWAGITGKPATFPPDATAMLKAVYDVNGDGISDHAALADTAPWTGISGKPSTFPPDSTAMLRSVYDINGNNKVDGAETADAVPWTGVTGKPATFPSDWNTTLNKPTLPDPGTWTNLTYSTGWTQNATAQFRVETNGSFQTVVAHGIINYASGAASLAFTLPTGARPGVARGCVVAGFDSSGDTQLFQATIATSGAVNIAPMVRANFSWPSATNGSVYLDNLVFSL